MVQTKGKKYIQSKSRIAFFFFFENVIGLIGSAEIYKFTTTVITHFIYYVSLYNIFKITLWVKYVKQRTPPHQWCVSWAQTRIHKSFFFLVSNFTSYLSRTLKKHQVLNYGWVFIVNTKTKVSLQGFPQTVRHQNHILNIRHMSETLKTHKH